MAVERKVPAHELATKWVESWRAVPPRPVYIGIDPGATGAIGVLSGNLNLAVRIPTASVAVTRTKKDTEGKSVRKAGSTTVFDLGSIVEIFRCLKPVMASAAVMLEKPPPSMGPGRQYAEIKLAAAHAMWPLFLVAEGWSFSEVSPSSWKASLGLSGQDKNVSRLRASSLFPGVRLTLVKDHDLAEALLLAEYCRRQQGT